MFPNDVYADCAAIDEIEGHDPMMCMEMSCGRCTYTMNRDYEAGAAAGAANGRCMPIDDYDIGGLLGEWNELGCAAYFSDVDLPSTPTDYTESIFADSEYVPAPMCAYALDKCKHGMSCNTIYECSFYFGGNESLYDATSSQYEMEWAACNNNYAPHCDECIRYALCPNVHENKMLPPVVLDLLEEADGHLPKVWPFSVLSAEWRAAEGLEDDEDALEWIRAYVDTQGEQNKGRTGCTDTSAVNYDPNADASCDAQETLNMPGKCVCKYAGCMNTGAANYDPMATLQKPGSCDFSNEIRGCMQSAALNFDPEATKPCNIWDNDDGRPPNGAASVACESCVKHFARAGGCGLVTGQGVPQLTGEQLVPDGCDMDECFDEIDSFCHSEMWQDRERCVCKVAIAGCTMPEAANYNPEATTPDLSACEWEKKPGCMDSRAPNYDPAATVNACRGCTDERHPLYEPWFNENMAMCKVQSVCLDPDAENFRWKGLGDDFNDNRNALMSYGVNGVGMKLMAAFAPTSQVCGEWQPGYDLDNATAPYLPLLTFMDQLNLGCCIVGGCKWEGAANYDPAATYHDFSCVGAVGCTDPTAENYNDQAQRQALPADRIPNGLCRYADRRHRGCVDDPDAWNYAGAEDAAYPLCTAATNTSCVWAKGYCEYKYVKLCGTNLGAMQNCKLKLEGDAEYADVRVETAEDGCVVFAVPAGLWGVVSIDPSSLECTDPVYKAAAEAAGVDTPVKDARRRRLAKASGKKETRGRTRKPRRWRTRPPRTTTALPGT